MWSSKTTIYVKLTMYQEAHDYYEVSGKATERNIWINTNENNILSIIEYPEFNYTKILLTNDKEYYVIESAEEIFNKMDVQ